MTSCLSPSGCRGSAKIYLSKNLLKEKNIMISYLGDQMEDATDFSWQGAKAAHAVLLCEMEWDSLQWDHLDRIDHIRRAHTQKHMSNRSGGSNPWITQVGNHGTAKTTKLVNVVTHVTMSSMGKSINIFVHFVWLGEPNGASRKRMST